jgi:hypothetical protein
VRGRRSALTAQARERSKNALRLPYGRKNQRISKAHCADGLAQAIGQIKSAVRPLRLGL